MSFCRYLKELLLVVDLRFSGWSGHFSLQVFDTFSPQPQHVFLPNLNLNLNLATNITNRLERPHRFLLSLVALSPDNVY